MTPRDPADRQRLASPPLRRVLVLSLVALGLAVLGSPQITRPVDRYGLGDFTTRSVRAPYEFSVIDQEATRQQRQLAAARSPIVARFESRTADSLRERFSNALDEVDGALSKTRPGSAGPGGSPPTSPARESTSARRRQAEAFARSLDEAWAAAERGVGLAIPEAVRHQVRDRVALAVLKDAFSALVAEAYGAPVTVSATALRHLLAGVEPPDTPARVALVDASTGQDLGVVNLGTIIELASARSRLADQAPRLLSTQPGPVVDWLVAVVGAWLRPTVLADEEATRARREAAAAAVLPVSLSFRSNQLIIGEGQPVTRQTLLALEQLRRQRVDRATGGRVLGRAGAILALLLLAFWTERGINSRFGFDRGTFPYALTSLVATAVLFKAWLEMTGSVAGRYPGLPESAMVLLFPATATAMYASVVLSRQAAATYLVVQSLLLGLLWQLDLPHAINLLLTGAVAGRLAWNCNRRQCVIRAGLFTGLLVWPAAAGMAAIGGGTYQGPVTSIVVATIAGCALSGVVLLAVGPLFEWMFGHLTRIRLVELMNYQHPLLRRLTEFTPGTFQHSVTIGLLADAAARSVDADALLARVGALYHDAGKTEHPDYFVENQHGMNPHDAISPAESARLVIAHVETGVRLVREFGVGERIADFVREHHGTSLVRHFLALAQQADAASDPDAFRYPGPRPRSRETTIVMIADQVEAIARAMGTVSEGDLRAMVEKTIARIVDERQLDDCPLTFQELSAIREALVRVLVGVHHRRVEYADSRTGAPRDPSSQTVGRPAAPA